MSLIGGDLLDPEPWRITLPWIHSLTRRSIGQAWVHHANDQGRMFGTKTRSWQMDTVVVMETVEHPSTDVSFRLTFDAEKGGKARERTPATRADFSTKLVTLINDKWSYRLEQGKPGKVKADSVAAHFLLALRAALSLAAGVSSTEDAPPGTTVTRDVWMAECVRRGVLDDPNEKPDAFRSNRSRYIRELVAAGAIVVHGEMVRLK
jgi:hypothetical protein